MSLLFEYAVDRFSFDNSSLYDASEDNLTTIEASVPVRSIAEFAEYHESLSHPDREWVCIPLHGQADATPTGTYIGYTNHEVRDRIFLVEQHGEVKPIPAEEFGQTRLAERIRFWHSDYLPETYPPDYHAPIDDYEDPQQPVESDDVLAEFTEYVHSEQAAMREQHRTRAETQSAQTLYERGDAAIPTAVSLGETDGWHQFRVELGPELQTRREDDWSYFVESEFGIYEGNEVLLHASEDDAPDTFPITAEVQQIRGRNVWLTINWESVADTAVVAAYLDAECAIGISELLNPVPFQRELEAIEDLRGTAFEEVLAGQRPVTFSNEAAALSDQFDTELNQEQQLAVRYALLADELFCIHGPPGTGKTRTLVEVIRRAVDAGEDVLVCADSNQAVDNLVVGSSTRDTPDLNSLHGHGQHGDGEFTLDRVNAERSAHDLIREQYQDVAGSADVVAATNSSAATVPERFDLVVIDEATQATCTASCIPLARADRAVLAGDHRQLPPFSATEQPPESSYGLSLFEHLYADGGVYEDVGLQLKTQYRMHPEIAYFPNREFYDRTLRNGHIVDPLADRNPIEGYNIGGAVEVVDQSRANATEGSLVVHLIQQVLADIPPEEIGVITPYAAQARLLRRQITECLDQADAITVDTIDSFQGSEKAAIIISLVRSNAEGNIGFLGRPQDGPRRLNVALTRARRYCAVVGDFHTLRYDADNKQTELYRDLRDHFATTGRLRDVDPEFVPGSET
jgi:hypothetical protein